jgi:hypothetical protein
MYILFADRSQSAFLHGTDRTEKKEKPDGGTTIDKEKKRTPLKDA